VENGGCFPKIGMLEFFQRKNNLDINWLISGDGSIFFNSPLKFNILVNNPMYNQYAELIDLLQIPVIEQIMLAKLQYLKVLAKYEIKEWKTGKKIERKKRIRPLSGASYNRYLRRETLTRRKDRR
jgi:hypothetical protein